jgi:DNA polymerase elongation subunit (family B)
LLILSSGDKIRYFYVVQPNKYRCNTIGFKYFWPNEFNTDFEIDYEFMFQKQIYDILERFYSCVGWRLRKPSETPVTDLFSFLAV